MKRPFIPLAGAILALSASCQAFFTTSLATALAREPEVPSSLTADQAAAYAEQLAVNPSPALAQAAVPALADLVAADPTPQVVADASAIAVTATGLDSALTEALTTLDVDALIAGDPLSAEDSAALAATLATVVVTDDTTAIFEALAAADPAELAAAGVEDATVYVVAAAALAIADMEDQGVSVDEIISGTTSYSPSADLQDTLADLADGAVAMDPNSVFVGLLQGLLGF